MNLSVGRRFAGDEEGLVADGSSRRSVTRLVDEPASDANQHQFACQSMVDSSIRRFGHR